MRSGDEEIRPGPGARRASWARMARQLLRRPTLLGLAVRTAWRFRARGWYRRPPFLPVPPPEYLDWRLETAYGSEDSRVPTPAEMERYLRWAGRTRSGR